MKKIILTLTTLLCLSFSLANENIKNFDSVTVVVKGLGCPFCAYGLEKQFKTLPDIKNMKLDIITGELTFFYPSDKEINFSVIEDKVSKAGYTLMSSQIKRSDNTVEESLKGGTNNE